MKIGDIVGQRGQKVNGRVLVGYTTGRLPVEIPVTIVMGAEPGKTLVVRGAEHGNEILGPLGIGKVLREIDPSEMSGNLVAIPVANMAAFEMDKRLTPWDNGNLEDVGSGKPDGNITEQLAYRLFQDTSLKGDAHISIHSGRGDAHVWYTIYMGEQEVEGADPEVVAKSKEMAMAFGLQQVWRSTPWSDAVTKACVGEGIPAIMPEVGGGPDFLQNGKKQVEWCARGIVNVMKLMGILPGEIETESNQSVIWDGHEDILNQGVGGLMELRVGRGERVKKGDVIAVKYDPTTGEELEPVLAPRDGVTLNTGSTWPLCPPGYFLGTIGEKIEEVDLTDHEWSFE